jgi:hypothetical protein
LEFNSVTFRTRFSVNVFGNNDPALFGSEVAQLHKLIFVVLLVCRNTSIDPRAPKGRWPVISFIRHFQDTARWSSALARHARKLLTARKHVQKIILSSPGQYIILNQITGDKVVLGQTCVPTQVASSGVESGDAARNGMD